MGIEREPTPEIRPKIPEIDYSRMHELSAGDPVTEYVGFPEVQMRIIEEDFFCELGLDYDDLDPDLPITEIPVRHA